MCAEGGEAVFVDIVDPVQEEVMFYISPCFAKNVKVMRILFVRSSLDLGLVLFNSRPPSGQLVLGRLFLSRRAVVQYPDCSKPDL